MRIPVILVDTRGRADETNRISKLFLILQTKLLFDILGERRCLGLNGRRSFGRSIFVCHDVVLLRPLKQMMGSKDPILTYMNCGSCHYINCIPSGRWCYNGQASSLCELLALMAAYICKCKYRCRGPKQKFY